MYLVVENTPGCLPESDGFLCSTFEEAVDVAKRLKAELRDQGYRVRGNIRRDLMYVAKGRGLDRVVEIVEVPF